MSISRGPRKQPHTAPISTVFFSRSNNISCAHRRTSAQRQPCPFAPRTPAPPGLTHLAHTPLHPPPHSWTRAASPRGTCSRDTARSPAALRRARRCAPPPPAPRCGPGFESRSSHRSRNHTHRTHSTPTSDSSRSRLKREPSEYVAGGGLMLSDLPLTK